MRNLPFYKVKADNKGEATEIQQFNLHFTEV